MAALKSGDRNLRHVSLLPHSHSCKTVCRSLFNQEDYVGITVIAVRRTGECTGFIDRSQGVAQNPTAQPTLFTLFPCATMHLPI